ncbi:hypothetical protein, partial [Paraburkholderia aspalathi]|uniref:hypothetical protein n=1 Tax=Paraburkholderia aspalathi TaxID=1324617 RepID=UPI001BAAD39A
MSGSVAITVSQSCSSWAEAKLVQPELYRDIVIATCMDPTPFASFLSRCQNGLHTCIRLARWAIAEAR